MTPLCRLGSLVLIVAGLSACATQTPPATGTAATEMPTTAAAEAPPTVGMTAAEAQFFFAVLPETRRIYAFGDAHNYFNFLSHGEVVFTRTRIGEGPGGRTLVYGITSDDVKSNQPSLGEQVMAGTLPAAPNFYGEAFKAGRYHVFGDLKDVNHPALKGEA